MNTANEKRNCSRCLKCARMGEAEYCRRCLVEVVEKRVSKKLNMVNGGSGNPGSSRVLIEHESKSSLSCAAAAYLAKKLCKAVAVSVIKPASQRSRMRQPHSAVIMAKCADEAATSLLEMFTSNAISSRRGVASDATDAVNIFESVTEKELELYAIIRKIKYTKEKESSLKRSIQGIQARYPGTIEALAQASRQVEEIRHKPA